MKDDETPVYGSSEFGGVEDKGICQTCGEWNCDLHITVEKTTPEGFPLMMVGLDEDIFKKISDFMKGASMKPDEVLSISSGKETKHELSEEDAAEEDDGYESIEPSMVVHSGGSAKISEKKDRDGKSSSPHDVAGLKWIKDEIGVTPYQGSPLTVRHYKVNPDAKKFKTMSKAVEAYIPKFYRQLYLALEAQARVARERGRKSGSIDAGRVSKLVTDGKTDVFAKKAHRKAMNTAISIVLDCSGSMDASLGYGAQVSKYGVDKAVEDLLKSKGGTCAAMGLMICEVANKLQGVKTEVLGYQSYMGRGHQKPEDRWVGHFTETFKSFDESYSAVKERLGGYISHAGGDHPYDGCMFAASRLYKQEADLKILFFISDAQPGNAGVEKLGKLADEFEKKYDILLVGVGIGEDYLKPILGNRAEIVMNLDSLNDQMFNRISKLIHPVK